MPEAPQSHKEKGCRVHISIDEKIFIVVIMVFQLSLAIGRYCPQFFIEVGFKIKILKIMKNILLPWARGNFKTPATRRSFKNLLQHMALSNFITSEKRIPSFLNV